MSDGPHRSLRMKRGWQRVAERADNGAFGVDEISNAVIPALERSPGLCISTIWQDCWTPRRTPRR